MLTHLRSLPLHFGFQISEMVTKHRYDVSLVRTQTNIIQQRQKAIPRETIRVCTSLKTLVTLSKPIIQPMSWSSTASRNGWVLRRLSILSTDRMAIFFLSLNASVPITIQWFLNFYIQRLLGQFVGVLIVQNTSLVSPGPTPNFNLPILPISLRLSPGKLSELSLVPKHLTCVSRTYSQPQPVEIFSMLISRQVVGAFTCPNTSLVSPGFTPNLSLSRYSQSFRKHVVFRQSIDKSPSTNDLTANMPQKWSENKKTHHLNQDYSSSSMPLTLHQQCTNLVITSEP